MTQAWRHLRRLGAAAGICHRSRHLDRHLAGGAPSEQSCVGRLGWRSSTPSPGSGLWPRCIAVALIVLRPIGGSGSVTGVNLVPFKSLVDLVNNSVDVSVAVRNIAGNVLLFVPVGFTFGLVLRRHRHMILAAMLAGLATSLVVEVVQLVFALGRVVDIDDVILNVVGTWIGALIAALALRLIDRPRQSQGDRAGTW